MKSAKSDKAEKKVAFNDTSQKMCYNCAEKGHLAKDCKNPKGVKDKQAPWPQTKQLDPKITRVSRGKVEWSTKELASIKEYVRVTECLIDMRAQTAKMLKKKELTSKTVKKTVTIWNKATNVKVEKVVEMPSAEYAELETHATQLLMDVAETQVILNGLEKELLKVCELTSREKHDNFLISTADTGELITEVLKEMKTAADTSRELKKTRIKELAVWLHAVKQEALEKQRKHVVEEVMSVIDKDAKKRATGAAEGLVNQGKPPKEKEPTIEELLSKKEERVVIEKKVISELETTLGQL